MDCGILAAAAAAAGDVVVVEAQIHISYYFAARGHAGYLHH